MQMLRAHLFGLFRKEQLEEALTAASATSPVLIAVISNFTLQMRSDLELLVSKQNLLHLSELQLSEPVKVLIVTKRRFCKAKI